MPNQPLVHFAESRGFQTGQRPWDPGDLVETDASSTGMAIVERSLGRRKQQLPRGGSLYWFTYQLREA